MLTVCAALCVCLCVCRFCNHDVCEECPDSWDFHNKAHSQLCRSPLSASDQNKPDLLYELGCVKPPMGNWQLFAIQIDTMRNVLQWLVEVYSSEMQQTCSFEHSCNFFCTLHCIHEAHKQRQAFSDRPVCLLVSGSAGHGQHLTLQMVFVYAAMQLRHTHTHTNSGCCFAAKNAPLSGAAVHCFIDFIL